jgi:TrpR-related protein YerC/YecD
MLKFHCYILTQQSGKSGIRTAAEFSVRGSLKNSEEGAMNKKIRTEAVDQLFDAILCLQSKEECYKFFEDLCTVKELLSLSQRLEVASMLRENSTYLDIGKKTGASTATISRVNRSLNYGEDGYQLVFDRRKE